MKYRITHTTKYAYQEPVSVCQNKAHLRPRDTQHQSCDEFRLLTVPDPLELNSRLDYFGNKIDYFSLHTPHNNLAVTATSVVKVTKPATPAQSPPWEEIAGQVVAPQTDETIRACLFRFPSEFTQLDEKYADYARKSFTPARPIVEAAQDLTHRIYEEFQYDARATTVSTPVAEVFETKAGVCQDFAHLQISCLRSLGLPARYVSGYLRTEPAPGKEKLVGADESHAWLSVFCGPSPGNPSGWIDFDPTNDVTPSTDHITLAYGRDYGDVCPLQGVFVGGGKHTLTVSVDVSEI